MLLRKQRRAKAVCGFISASKQEMEKSSSVQQLTLREFQNLAQAGLMRLSIPQQAAESPECCCCHLHHASCSGKQPAAQTRHLHSLLSCPMSLSAAASEPRATPDPQGCAGLEGALKMHSAPCSNRSRARRCHLSGGQHASLLLRHLKNDHDQCLVRQTDAHAAWSKGKQAEQITNQIRKFLLHVRMLIEQGLVARSLAPHHWPLGDYRTFRGRKQQDDCSPAHHCCWP